MLREDFSIGVTLPIPDRTTKCRLVHQPLGQVKRRCHNGDNRLGQGHVTGVIGRIDASEHECSLKRYRRHQGLTGKKEVENVHGVFSRIRTGKES